MRLCRVGQYPRYSLAGRRAQAHHRCHRKRIMVGLHLLRKLVPPYSNGVTCGREQRTNVQHFEQILDAFRADVGAGRSQAAGHFPQHLAHRPFVPPPPRTCPRQRCTPSSLPGAFPGPRGWTCRRTSASSFRPSAVIHSPSHSSVAASMPPSIDEIGPGAERLDDVTGRAAAAVGADVSLVAVGRVGAFDDRRKLRIAHAGHPPRRADAARPDADFHDVGPALDQQFLHHLRRGHVSGHDRRRGAQLADVLHSIDEELRVAVGGVDADQPRRTAGFLNEPAELLEIVVADAERVERGTGGPDGW